MGSYIFETRFVEESKVLHIQTKTSTSLSCTKCLNDWELLYNINTGILYHHRYKHPVIDGVAVLERGKRKAMLNFYSGISKLFCSDTGDLLRPLQCPELKNSGLTTLMEYYKEMCPQVKDIQIINLYVSPHELSEEKIVNGEENIDFGIIKKHSLTH